MMNFRKIAATSKGHLILRYFTENTPEPIHPPALDEAGRELEPGGRLTAYYTGRESRATWRPDMPAILADAIGINPRRMARDEEISRLFEARRADDGEAWSQHKRKLSGFDLVFSPHKSVTLATEFAATPAESAAYWNAVDRANDRAMRYVALVLGWARKGAGGEDGAEPGAVGWMTFRHSTARPTLAMQDGVSGPTYILDAPVAGDPHMHAHNFLMNLVVTAEGRVGSLDTKALSETRVKEFGAYFQAILADELRRLGVRVGYDAGEQAIVIRAIPEHVNMAFSKRDKQILHKAKAFARSQGLEWDDLSVDRKMEIVEEASADGRLGKMQADEKRIWREQAAALGWRHNTAMEDARYDTLIDEERFERAYQFAAEHLATEFKTAAIRERLKARGEIAGPEQVHAAIDQRGQEYELALARGDRVRLFRRTWGLMDGREQQVGNNGDVVTVLTQSDTGIQVRAKDGKVADIEWRRLADVHTGRLLLGLGHALTIDAAQGLTSDEHINALPRGTGGVSAFTSYVAESRSRGTTWTIISEGALHEAERHRQALGDITPITAEDLWARAAEDMSDKPYKGLGIDLLASALRDREEAVDTFIACSHRIEAARVADPEAGPKAFERLRAAAINESLSRHLSGLGRAIAENEVLLGNMEQARETQLHLRALHAEAAEAARQMDAAGANQESAGVRVSSSAAP